MKQFSISIPTRDRPTPRGPRLGAITRLETPSADVEVIVVNDNGSVDFLPAMEPTVGAGVDVRVIANHGGGPAAAS